MQAGACSVVQVYRSICSRPSAFTWRGARQAQGLSGAAARHSQSVRVNIVFWENTIFEFGLSLGSRTEERENGAMSKRGVTRGPDYANFGAISGWKI